MRGRLTSMLLGAVIASLAGMPGFAQTAALSGRVVSAKEGAMEGVLLTARKRGSTMATTIVSDAQGNFAFPAGRLEPGRYELTIRAFGYELDGPVAIDVTPRGTTADVKLRETTNLLPQMTNAEWLLSAPGTAEEKRAFSVCSTCHVLSLAMLSHYTAARFKDDVLVRMAMMSSQAMPGLVQRRIIPNDPQMFGDLERLSKYLASINLSTSPEFKFPLKGLDRPKGRGTRVIITSYDLPRSTVQAHDTVMGDDGYVWISNFGENSLLRLDPKTGAVKEYTYEPTRPGPYANGNLDLEFDRDGYVWLGMMNQTGTARFDRRTEQFTFYPIPPEMRDLQTQTGMIAPVNSHVDGKVWIQAVSKPEITRLDKASGKFEPWRNPFGALPGTHAAYGVYSDSKNNAYLLDFPTHYIWKIDARTGETRYFKTPTERSRPRRGRMDVQDRLWFAEYWTDKIGMFDTKTGQFKEWDVPGFMASPYDAELDKNGWVWTNNMIDDRVSRLNPATGEWIQYLMPIETNARRVAVDNYAARPVLWVGAHHQAAVLKVEPLD